MFEQPVLQGVTISPFSVLKASQGHFTAEELFSDTSKFTPAPSNLLNYGHTQSTIWCRLDLVNNTTSPEELYLVTWNPNLDDVTLFIRRDDGKITSITSGDMVSSRPIPWVSGQAIPFTLNAGENIQLLLRSHTETGLQVMPISFLVQDALERIAHIKSVIHGFLIGICIALLLYNIMLFLSLNDITYVYYAAYLTTAIIIISGLTGLGMTTFWTHNVWLSNTGMVFFGALSKIFVSFFSRKILETKTTPALDRLLLFTTGLAVAYLICTLVLPVFTAFQVATAIFFIFPLLFCWAGIWAWLTGKRQARFYILGQVASWLALLVFGLTVLGVISYNDLTFEIVPVAICMDAMLLSMALADRMRDLQTQKILAQEQARQNLEIKREELEKLVAQRTLELTEARDEAVQIARTDALTKIFNRRYAMEMGGREFARSKRLNTSLAVAIMDIDDFKHVNDTWGHDEGDRVLKAFADIISQGIRTADIFARWGGEEFLLILPDTEREAAQQLLERLRLALWNDLTFGQNQERLSASFGFACRKQNDHNFESIITRADQALYEAKRSGKNAVVFFEKRDDAEKEAAP
ncbi:diguanylate cyclase [Desulfovibrio inopinatus]|uniref:diguanylate cyclase n=1 Tax=Desulfovibrio inopinatus TaxID=102109 RepID=UPI00146F9821|nr:diguanylate cyclase [Desulfovibrio inopinatus]